MSKKSSIIPLIVSLVAAGRGKVEQLSPASGSLLRQWRPNEKTLHERSTDYDISLRNTPRASRSS
jgi:hypothetical protein